MGKIVQFLAHVNYIKCGWAVNTVLAVCRSSVVAGERSHGHRECSRSATCILARRRSSNVHCWYSHAACQSLAQTRQDFPLKCSVVLMKLRLEGVIDRLALPHQVGGEEPDPLLPIPCLFGCQHLEASQACLNIIQVTEFR